MEIILLQRNFFLEKLLKIIKVRHLHVLLSIKKYQTIPLRKFLQNMVQLPSCHYQTIKHL